MLLIRYFNSVLGLGVTSIYSNVTIHLMLSMYWYRRFEFQLHIKRMLALYFATMLSVAVFTVFDYMGIMVSFCFFGGKEAQHDAFFSKEDQGICDKLADFLIFYRFRINAPTINAQTLTVFLEGLIILPVAVYLLTNEPHDCFVCLNKDPDRAYSIYQMTTDDKIKRRMVAKYNAEQRRS